MKAKQIQQTENANPIYFRLGYDESLESKKDLLSSEMSFLNIVKIARRYNSLRAEEAEIKNRICKAIKELDAALKKTKASFPFLKIPERAKREELRKETGTIKRNIDDDLEGELRKIQERLKSISER